MVQFHATTICAVRRGPDDICIGGDGHYYATDPQQVEQILQLISSYL